MRQFVGGRSEPRRLLLLSIFLVAYGNAASLALGGVATAGGFAGIAIGWLLIGISSLWAGRVARLGLAEIGLTRVGAVRSAGLGLLVALALVGPALLILKFPPIFGNAVTYTPLASLTREDLLWRTLLFMPLDTVLPEEIAFRGVLLAGLRRRYAAGPAVVLAAAPFALWHGVLLGRTLELTNLLTDPLSVGLGWLGGFAAVFFGGVLFGIVRVATGHLAGSILAHWGFNTALLFGLQALHA